MWSWIHHDRLRVFLNILLRVLNELIVDRLCDLGILYDCWLVHQWCAYRLQSCVFILPNLVVL